MGESKDSTIRILDAKDGHSNESTKAQDYTVAFSGKSKSYCVGLADIVNSTRIAARLDAEKMSRYYEIFMNSISQIVSRFQGSVIKNVGDAILYYFPESSKPDQKSGFLACLECNLAMCEARDTICTRLHEKDLPSVDFRISSDYGTVVIVRMNNSSLPDMFGPPINMCTKMNLLAPRNGVVIGADLYQMVKYFDDYCFKPIKGYSPGLYSYDIYSVGRNK